MEQRLVSLKLPADLVAAIERAAHQADISPAEAIRGALKAAYQGARSDQRDLSAVHRALARAEGWLELQSLLRASGFVLRADAARVLLCSWPLEAEILPLEALGTSLAALTLRYRADFPGMVRGRPLCRPAA